MKKYIAFDNGGITPDRYTVVNKETADVFGFSEDPGAPNGVAQLCGNCAEHLAIMSGAGWRQSVPAKKLIQAQVENYINNARLSPDWLGFEIDFAELPISVRDCVLEWDAPHNSNQAAPSRVRHIA
jgi:hypothetical protein